MGYLELLWQEVKRDEQGRIVKAGMVEEGERKEEPKEEEEKPKPSVASV
jgi:hypothetical protein